MSSRGISVVDSECGAESFQFSPGKNAENIEEREREESAGGYKDTAEGGDFKNKRAAHYNEFKLG